MLPNPDKIQKYLYITDTSTTSVRFLYLFGIISWTLVLYGFYQIINSSVIFKYLIFPILIIFTFYHYLAFGINLFYNKFDLKNHKDKVKRYHSKRQLRRVDLKREDVVSYPLVDIYLPICGEEMSILINTWKHVANIEYQNKKVYVLDDSPTLCIEHRVLAEKFGFIYIERPNKGEVKKAGNLKYAFERTKGEFITIFDADFSPHKDFLKELLPYMDDHGTGIIQSPQYFDTSVEAYKHSPLAYAAAYREEIFYRVTQVARDRFDAAICCGSNAIYRRKALESIGGPRQVTASEDSRTGFALLNNGYKTKYLPIILAIGICPDNVYAYYHQQHRWVRGRSELVLSKEFRDSKLSWGIKLCNISGFLSFILRPLELLLSFNVFLFLFLYNPNISSGAWLFFIAYLIFSFIIYPAVHITKFKKEVFFASMIQMYASIHSVLSVIMGKTVAWIPTNAKHTTISNSFKQSIYTSSIYFFIYMGMIIGGFYLGIIKPFNTQTLGMQFWILWNFVLSFIMIWVFWNVRNKMEGKVSVFNAVLHQIIVTVISIIIGVFALWWFQLSHIPNNFQGAFHILDIILFIIISYIIWHPIIMSLFNWLVTSHIHDRTFLSPQRGLKVAFLTTFVPASESLDLLHKCLPAMVNAKYPHHTWLLDEGNSLEAREVCRQYGVKYFTRNGKAHYNQDSGKFKAKTKGGNHNAWHDVYGHNYDIIAQIDTDFIPKDTFLTKTLGFFTDPKIGFVGTPQIYGNTSESFIALGAAQQTYNFYGPILRGLDGMKMNTLIGANHLIRVKALESIDHYSAHITEDLLTGMKFHANGWESVYVPEVLATGEGPSEWQSYFNQQMRWAYGCIDILFKHSFHLFKSMSLRQKIYYFLLQQHYFSGIAMILGILGLVAYFLFSFDIAQIELIPFLVFYLPIIIVIEIMNIWVQKFNVRPQEEKGILLAGRIISIASWPIFFMALIGVLRGKKLSYKVTPKGQGSIQKVKYLHLFIPHFIIGLITLICFLSIFITGRGSIIMIFWAASITITMFLVPFSNQIAGIIFQLKNTVKQLLFPSATKTRHYILWDMFKSTITPIIGILVLLYGYILVFLIYSYRGEVSSDLNVSIVTGQNINRVYGYLVSLINF